MNSTATLSFKRTSIFASTVSCHVEKSGIVACRRSEGHIINSLPSSPRGRTPSSPRFPLHPSHPHPPRPLIVPNLITHVNTVSYRQELHCVVGCLAAANTYTLVLEALAYRSNRLPPQPCLRSRHDHPCVPDNPGQLPRCQCYYGLSHQSAQNTADPEPGTHRLPRLYHPLPAARADTAITDADRRSHASRAPADVRTHPIASIQFKATYPMEIILSASKASHYSHSSLPLHLV